MNKTTVSDSQIKHVGYAAPISIVKQVLDCHIFNQAASI